VPLSGQVAVRNQGYVPFSEEPINYRGPVHDPVAQPQQRLASSFRNRSAGGSAVSRSASAAAAQDRASRRRLQAVVRRHRSAVNHQCRSAASSWATAAIPWRLMLSTVAHHCW